MAYVSMDGVVRGDKTCWIGHSRCSIITGGDCSREDCEKGHSRCSARPNGHCGEVKRAPRGKAFKKGDDPRRTGIKLNEDKSMETQQATYSEGDRCPKCGSGNLTLKTGAHGAFLGCDEFPRCRFTRSGKTEKSETETVKGEADLSQVRQVEGHGEGAKGEQAKGQGQSEQKGPAKAAKGGEKGEGQGEGDGAGEGQGEGEGEGEGESDAPPPPQGAMENRVAEIAFHIASTLDGKVLETVQEALEELAKDGKLKVEAKEVIEVKFNDADVKRIEGTKSHSALADVLLAIKCGLNVLLVGPAGCGKTHLAGQVAQALGVRYGSLSCSAGMSESQLTGRLLPMGEKGIYLPTQFVDFYENGGLFLLDEMDAADANVLLVINQALANGYLPLPNRLDKPYATKHESFVLLGAANTYGHGADRVYVGRNQLDGAFLDRFAGGVFSLDYDRGVEKSLCPNDALLAKWWGIRDKARSLKLRQVVSTRGLIAAHRYVTVGNLPVDKAIRRSLESWTQDDRTKVGITN